MTNVTVAHAASFDLIATRGIVDDAVTIQPIVVAFAPDGTLVAYDHRFDGETLAFTLASERFLRAGCSCFEWLIITAIND